MLLMLWLVCKNVFLHLVSSAGFSEFGRLNYYEFWMPAHTELGMWVWRNFWRLFSRFRHEVGVALRMHREPAFIDGAIFKRASLAANPTSTPRVQRCHKSRQVGITFTANQQEFISDTDKNSVRN
jgi:hypothetical protein